MVGEPEWNERATADQGRVLDAVRTPEVLKKLGDLALLWEKQLELSEAFAQAGCELTSLVEGHPEFERVTRDLLAKMAQLCGIQGELARKVMRYLHLYEDSIVNAANPAQG